MITTTMDIDNFNKHEVGLKQIAVSEEAVRELTSAPDNIQSAEALSAVNTIGRSRLYLRNCLRRIIRPISRRIKNYLLAGQLRKTDEILYQLNQLVAQVQSLQSNQEKIIADIYNHPAVMLSAVRNNQEVIIAAMQNHQATMLSAVRSNQETIISAIQPHQGATCSSLDRKNSSTDS